MDTKLKSNNFNKGLGVFVGLFIIIILAVSMVELYDPIYKNSKQLLKQNEAQKLSYEKEEKEFLKEEFIKMLYRSNFVLSLDVLRKGNNNNLMPSDIFLTDYMKASQDGEDSFGKEEFNNCFNDMLNNWYTSFYYSTIQEYPSFSYYVIDNNTGKVLTNSIDSLASLLDATAQTQKLKDSKLFYIIFKYGKDGTLSISEYKGLEKTYTDELSKMQLNNNIMQEESSFSDWYHYNDQIVMPENITIIYASNDENFYVSGVNDYNYYWDSHLVFFDAGFDFAYASALLLIIILALILPFVKAWGIGKGFTTRIPFEISAAAAVLTIAAFDTYVSMAWETVSAGYVFDKDFTVFSEQIQHILTYLLNVLVWIVVFGILYLSVLSMRQVFSLGVIRYLKEKTLTGRCICWFFRVTKRVYTLLEKIDLSSKSNKTMITLLVINFILLSFLCCTWVIGIILLIPYSIFLFIIISKYLGDIKKKYGILLEATGKLADGNLDVIIEENLGIFEPLKEEFTKIQLGFRKAVKEETKSERMKTELITNVSHDLKTPLTALITYINLLKEKNISDEERQAYIDTLDMKSQRLKRLIEDLFEMSKAASNNITLNIIEVDLVNLIKQVLLELDDKIKQADIEFRLNLAEPKMILNLDSEITYRIFENLVINITKYAMPHTRAYVDMILKEDTVFIAMKNMSAAEMNFNAEEISERFVRGDLSRNTEGSGLGLAITKSFVELQGGDFTIVADGDLFKVLIEWKRK